MVAEVSDLGNVEVFDFYKVEEEQTSSWNGRQANGRGYDAGLNDRCTVLAAGNDTPNIVLCGENCSAHREYSFDLSVDKDGLEAEGELKATNEDGDMEFTVGGSARVDSDGNTEASAHVGVSGKF